MMKNYVGICLLVMIMISNNFAAKNPLLKEWNTPFQVPPFNDIKEEHYLPAFKEAIKVHKAEIEAITANNENPTFANTIEALEYSGELLEKVEGVFYPLTGAVTNEKMQEIAQQVAPLRTQHYDDINLNSDLFKRIKAVYDKKSELSLNVEQAKLLEETYKAFVRLGANLPEDKKEKLRAINRELSVLTLQFGDNVLAETNKFNLIIEKESDLSRLPEWLISGAASTAEEANLPGKWIFSLHKPSWIPFLQYSDKRELREKLYKAWMNIGNNNDELDNKAIISKIVLLRTKRAQLLGYPTHADWVLEENMAKKPENVYKLLNQLWKPALHLAKAEVYDMQALIERENEDFRLQLWDWWYFTEKIRKEKYDLSDDDLKPYFQLENVISGMFHVVNKLYGLQFVEKSDIPTYHPDALAYEILEADGSHICILYMDFFPRASKQSGAWATTYRSQYKKDGKKIPPIISIVMNFSKPTEDNPSLLTLDEVLTFYHEFGHALHAMFSNVTFRSLGNVPRDFVELPSQIMENWVVEPEVLQSFAKHYQTEKPIPLELIDKIVKSNQFNQGFQTVEYLAASFLDMDYHTIEDTTRIADINEFEKNSMDKIELIPEIISRYKSPYFKHIFSGGYSAGYYSYIWSEVLDKDAFQAFKETSLFDQKTAMSFRKNVLEKGGIEEAMVLYKKFRGREPEITPLLKGRGLL